MNENKTGSSVHVSRPGKYLKYAIGEIILVVIGILIALQINTWNTNRIDSNKEKEYLNNLIEDIKTQKTLVKSQIDHEIRIKLQCEKALSHLNSTYIDADTLNVYLTNITRKTFVINDPTFQDLKSSGNFLLIKNNDLRKKIISFYQNLEYSAMVIAVSNENSIEFFRNFIIQNSVVNMNYKDSITVAGGVDYSLKSIVIPWANNVQEAKLKDKENLLITLNHISQRGRTSTVNLDLMQRIEQRIENIQSVINNYLSND